MVKRGKKSCIVLPFLRRSATISNAGLLARRGLFAAGGEEGLHQGGAFFL